MRVRDLFLNAPWPRRCSRARFRGVKGASLAVPARLDQGGGKLRLSRVHESEVFSVEGHIRRRAVGRPERAHSPTPRCRHRAARRKFMSIEEALNKATSTKATLKSPTWMTWSLAQRLHALQHQGREGDADRARKLLRDAREARRAAHRRLRHIRIGDGVEARELQRAEEPARSAARRRSGDAASSA